MKHEGANGEPPEEMHFPITPKKPPSRDSLTAAAERAIPV